MINGLTMEPYWWEAQEPRDLPAEPVAAKCDVVVVGAGYAGLSAALVLARAGRSVQVFDKQRPGEGASSRNGGIASGNIRMGFGKMIDEMGLEVALHFYSEARSAREGLAAFIDAEKIACDFIPCGRFTGAMQPSHYEAQGREADRLNKHLNISAEMVPKSEQHSEVGTDIYHGGMLRPDIGGLHPAKFHAGLMERAIKAGVTIHGVTAVSGIRGDGDGFEVETARGRVKAGQVIVATNGYTDKSDRWLQRRLVPVPSRIIATQPLPPKTMKRLMPKSRMYGETRHLYHYYRPSPDGTRLLFGGRERARRGEDQRSTTSLIADLGEIFPEMADVPLSHSWFGFVAFNRDFLPRMFERDGIHYATGFCGSGVVWAWWLGSKLGFKLIGDAKADTAFSCAPPRAVPFYAGSPWFLPAALFWYGLRDRMGVASKK